MDKKNVHTALKYSELDEKEMMSIVMKKLNEKRNKKLSKERRREIALQAVQARERKRKHDKNKK